MNVDKKSLVWLLTLQKSKCCKLSVSNKNPQVAPRSLTLNSYLHILEQAVRGSQPLKNDDIQM